MPVKGAGAVRFKFRNSINAFLHAKRISCILFCPEKQQQKSTRKGAIICILWNTISQKTLMQGGPGGGLGAGRCVSINGLSSTQGLTVSYFIEQLLRKDLGFLIQEPSALAIVLEKQMDRSWETLWRLEWTQGHLFTPNAITGLATPLVQLCAHACPSLPHCEALDAR